MNQIIGRTPPFENPQLQLPQLSDKTTMKTKNRDYSQNNQKFKDTNKHKVNIIHKDNVLNSKKIAKKIIGNQTYFSKTISLNHQNIQSQDFINNSIYAERQTQKFCIEEQKQYLHVKNKIKNQKHKIPKKSQRYIFTTSNFPSINHTKGKYSNYHHPFNNSPKNKKQTKKMYFTSQKNSINNSIEKNVVSKQSPGKYAKNSGSIHKINEKRKGNKLAAVSTVRNNNYLFESAKKYFLNNNYEASSNLFRQFISHFKSPSTLKLEALYFLGISLCNIGEFYQGIKELKKVIAINPKYEQSIYLILAQSYSRLKQLDQAIQILSIGLSLFRLAYDSWIYRGKIYFKKGLYQQSFQDFDKAIQINPYLGEAYYEKGMALKVLKKYRKAIKIFTKGIQTNLKYILHEVRGKCYFDIGDFDNSLKDFEICAAKSPKNSTFCYLKSMIYYNLGDNNLAIASFQQTINIASQQNNHFSQSIIGSDKSLEISKIGVEDPDIIIIYCFQMIIHMHVQEKDFKEAFAILKRISRFFDEETIENSILKQWKLLIESIVIIIKKKFAKAISKINELLQISLFNRENTKSAFKQIYQKRNQERYRFLKPLAFIYRAYAKIELSDFEGASKDYKHYEDICEALQEAPKQISYQYNKLILKSISLFPKSTRLFQEASKLIPLLPEPYLYIAFEQTQNTLIKLIQQQAKSSKVTISLMTQLKIDNEKSPNRLLSVPIQSSLESICLLIEKSINLSPKPLQKTIRDTLALDYYLAQLYYYKAVIKLYQNKYEEAMQCIEYAIKLSDAALFDEDQDNYLQIEQFKSKLEHQKLSNIRSYFYTKGLINAQRLNYESAVNNYNVSLSLQSSLDESNPLKNIYLQKAKCLKLLGNGEEALVNLYKYIQQCPEDQKIPQYLGVLLFQNNQFLNSLNAFSQIGHSKDPKVILIKAKCHFMCNQFKIARELLTMNKPLSKSDVYATDITIIQIFEYLDLNQEKLRYKEHMKKIIQISQKFKLPLKSQLNNNRAIKLFSNGEILLLRACLYMLLDQPDKAIQYFQKALDFIRVDKKIQLKKFQLQKKREHYSEQVLNAKQYLINQCWQKWNWREIQILYNMGVTHLCNQCPTPAIKSLEQALLINPDLQFQLDYIQQLIDISKRIVSMNMSVTKKIKLQNLKTEKLLSEHWPLMKLPGFQIYLQLLYSHPFVQPPQFLPQLDTSLFANFNLKALPLKPQIPWLKREKVCLIFTQNLSKNNIELLESEEQQEEQKILKQLKIDQFDTI